MIYLRKQSLVILLVCTKSRLWNHCLWHTECSKIMLHDAFFRDFYLYQSVYLNSYWWSRALVFHSAVFRMSRHFAPVHPVLSSLVLVTLWYIVFNISVIILIYSVILILLIKIFFSIFSNIINLNSLVYIVHPHMALLPCP